MADKNLGSNSKVSKVYIFVEAVVLYYCIYIEAFGVLNIDNTEIIEKIGDGALIESILFILLIMFLNRFQIVLKNVKFYEAFFSVIFSVFLIVGDSLKANDSLYCLYNTKKKIILVLFVCIGLSVFILHLW